MNLRKSTARTIIIGPILDADGVAKTDEVVASILASKNGSDPAALDGSATLTHKASGYYRLALTVNDTDTLGCLELILNSTTNTMPVKSVNVASTTAWDALYAASGGYLLAKDHLGNAIPTAATTAAAVWAVSTSGHATNTMGWSVVQTKISADGVYLRSQVITTGPSTVSSGDITLIRGDTYTSNSAPISFTLNGQPNLTGGTVTLTVRDANTDEAVLVANGSVTTGGAGITQVVDCVTAAGDTDDLPVGLHPYDCQVTLTTGEVWTVATGLANIVKDQTRAA